MSNYLVTGTSPDDPPDYDEKWENREWDEPEVDEGWNDDTDYDEEC